jgi:hypothetical protein
MTTQITLPELAAGQYNAGLILKEDGTPDYCLIGLPGELKAAPWQQAMDWAKEQGGDLPNRRELNLLRANARKEFKNDCYWSNETADYGTAFVQDFYDGNQYGYHRSAERRVRAVSRLPA